ncbi:MAG: M42 family peptidase, partial [Actinobacteria bacterium]|nr:M42 family peptidase [Actinomycetota bacterium]
PDVALVLDVTYATDVPAGDPNEAGHHVLGGGPAIFRGSAVNPHVFDLLVRAAEAEGIPYTVETGMRTYTDADDTSVSRAGVATGVVSLPLRNMHSPVETLELADLEACIGLVVAFAGLLGPGLNLAR